MLVTDAFRASGEFPPDLEALASRTVDARWEVYRHFGPGMYERVYQNALEMVLIDHKIPYSREVWIDVEFRGRRIEKAYRIDFVIGEAIGVEAKALDFLNPVYERQLISYLRLGNWPLGFLVNFNTAWFRSGNHRKVNGMAHR